MNKDVVILGGGVFGFSIAYHLAQEGIISQVIEMDSIAAKASGRSNGIISNAVGSMFRYAGSTHAKGGAERIFARLAEESFERFQRLHLELKENTGVDIQYTTYPQLRCVLCEDEERILAGIVSEIRQVGFDVRWISADEARKLESTLSPEVRCAVLLDSRQMEPYRYTLALAQGAEKFGSSIRYAQAVGFRHKRNKVTSVVLSNGRAVTTGIVVIAMGPWCLQAASWLGLKLPLNTLRAQTLKMVGPKSPRYLVSYKPLAVQEWPRISMCVLPRLDNTILVGYTEDRTDTWDDNCPETWLDTPTEEMKYLIIEHALRLVPTLEDAKLIEHRAGILGCPPTGGVLIGPVPNWENVYIATVGDGGIAISPAVGRIVTDLIVGGNRGRRAIEEIKTALPLRIIS